jgi:uncharacterized protein (DUF885 family)
VRDVADAYVISLADLNPMLATRLGLNPGHHLQLAQWTHLSQQLSVYQTTAGSVSACAEGWALYAERLMDELGYLSAPGARLAISTHR